MTHNEAIQLIDELHKNKTYSFSEWECQFLEDLSFYATIGSIKISEKQSKALQNIYRKSQGG